MRFVERMQAYALKAAREGKQETSWLNPHAAYEDGVKTFIARILDPLACPANSSSRCETWRGASRCWAR